MDTTFRKPGGQHDKMFRVLKEIFLTKTRDEWFDLLAPKDVPVGKVYAMDEVFTDPQILARKMVVELEDPKLGKIRQVGILPKLSSTPGSIRSLPPLHGDHTDEILREAGYSEKEIGEHRGKGIVG